MGVDSLVSSIPSHLEYEPGDPVVPTWVLLSPSGPFNFDYRQLRFHLDDERMDELRFQAQGLVICGFPTLKNQNRLTKGIAPKHCGCGRCSNWA